MSVARQEKRLMTAADLWEMPEVPGKRFELVEMPGAGVQHGKMMMALLRLLDPFVLEHGLGAVFGYGVGYILQLNPDVVRIPGVSFIAASRIAGQGLPEGFWYGPPDLAVEIVSPNDRATDVGEKVSEYLQAGASLVWVLWPRRKAISVHEHGGNARDLNPDDELTGGTVMPGFRVKVSAIFDG